MFADSNFATLCPDVDMSVWCLSPPTEGVCCGICPSGGISGLGGHISLAFSSLSSIAAIALSPASAPSSLVTNLIQADAYAVSLLGYLLSDSSGLGAAAASPPWAVTGQKSPAERQAEAEKTVLEVLQEMEAGHGDSSSSSDDEKRHLRRRKRKKRVERERLQRVLQDNPDLILNAGSKPPCCGIASSHLLLYISFSISVLLWGAALYLGVLGGATGSTRVALAQPNCTEGLGSAATLILYADIGFMILAVVVFVATILNHLMNDVANALNREVTTEYNGSTRLVFGVSFLVWLIWMGASFSIYFMAAQRNLLAAGEFSWSFGSTFSALMLIVPIYSVLKALWANR
ncbi:hypothetical protein JCM10213_003655 [Rhodosporidiobolus nylandii]